MKLLGVTGCPTGIAHTYMAQEALEIAAKNKGCTIKVETNGAIGVENKLTDKDIKEAEAIIVACDKNVDMERFNGKPVVVVSVKEGINKAEELIQKCLDGNVPIRSGSEHTTQEESIGHGLYKHLMNGVSHMLPLVVAGGVLTAISFLWGIYSFDPTHESYNVIAATLKNIGGVSMNLMVPIMAAFIAQSIAGRPGMLAGFVAGMLAINTGSGFLGGIIGGFFTGYLVLSLVKMLTKLPRELEGLKSIFILPIISVLAAGLFMILFGEPCAILNEWMMTFLSNLQDESPLLLGIVVGCMCAFDMGGPVNKAAYVTGTLLLGEGNYLFMAGVSAACITPPLVVAIAATFFKSRFTKEDRTAGLINYILGSTHITEGAIPFAAKNPLKVIPVLMIASSISAVLTYFAKVEVPAPHGGFLILGIVNEPMIWVGCILVGSTIGAVLYALVTPKQYSNESLFHKNTTVININGETKDEVIEEMVNILNKDGIVKNKKDFKQAIYEREGISSTGLSDGIAIPHAQSDSVTKTRVAIGISKKGFDFDTTDNEKSYLVFMIATPNNGTNAHLHALSSISKKLMHKDIVDAIKASTSPKDVISILERG